jgi:hypothetical protein
MLSGECIWQLLWRDILLRSMQGTLLLNLRERSGQDMQPILGMLG